MLTQLMRDTIYVTVRDTVLLRDTVVRVAAAAQRNGTPWIIPAITAGAAIVAGLAAQAFRVWLDARNKKRHLIASLDADLEAMVQLLKHLAEQRQQHGSISMQQLAQVDFLARSYENYEPEITLIGARIRRRVQFFYRQLTGIRETIRLIDQRNSAARRGEGTHVPADEVDSAYIALDWLRGLCVDAQAAVRLEHYKHRWLRFVFVTNVVRWKPTRQWWGGRQAARDNEEKETRELLAADAGLRATDADEKPDGKS